MNLTDSSNATVYSLQCEDSFIIWTCISLISFAFGFPGAVAVLLAMVQKGRRGTPFTPNDVFMINLTIMDGIYLFCLQPELYNHVHVQNLVYDAIITFIYSFTLCGRPLFIACICLDCYLAVVHPVTYRARNSLTPRVLMAVGVWIVTIVDGSYFLSARGKTSMDPTPILFFVLVLPVIGFCDFSILWTLKKSCPGGRKIHPQKKRALQIIINNMIITSVSYLPPIITLLVSQYLSLDENTVRCFVVIPVMHITTVGTTVSLLLYLNNLGKLEWIKCFKVK